MSKIGEKDITVPSSVQANINGQIVTLKGQNGEISIEAPEVITVVKENNNLMVRRKTNDKKSKSLHGLYRNLIANAVTGVEEAWKKRLEVVGTGYNVKLQGQDLVFKIGYSHPVVFQKKAGISYQVEGNTKIIVSGADKQLVGQTAHQIKILKKPDVYKGKGIRYEGEKLRIKPGKKAKAA